MTITKLSLGGLIFLLLGFTSEKAAAENLGTDDAQTREIHITARQFEFQPRTITLRNGKPVKLIITSMDVDHGFAIDDLGIDKKIPAGQSREVTFTPDHDGKFRFYCSVICGDGHKNMSGEIIVTDGEVSPESKINVRFADDDSGVVIVESNGERIRIDTASKTVTRLDDSETPPGTETSRTQPAGVEQKATHRTVEAYGYHLVNVPTPKRVPRHSLNVYFNHRFSTPINEDNRTFGEQFENLFGLDGFSVSSFGFTFGITDRLYVNAYRSPVCQPGLCKTIEIGLGYHLLDEAGRSPVALSAYASIEGNNNFKEEFTYNLQAMIARSVTEYVNLFFAPAIHINSNGQRRFNPRSENFFPPVPLADKFELGTNTGSFGFGVNARIRPTASLVFEYTPRIGFKLGRVEPLFNEDFTQITGFKNRSEPEIGFGIEKRLGRHTFSLTFSNTQTTTTSRYNSSNLVLPPSKFIIGFNLFRRLL